MDMHNTTHTEKQYYKNILSNIFSPVTNLVYRWMCRPSPLETRTILKYAKEEMYARADSMHVGVATSLLENIMKY